MGGKKNLAGSCKVTKHGTASDYSCFYCALVLLFQGHSVKSRDYDLATSGVDDQLLDESSSYSAADAATSNQLGEMSLSPDRSHNVDDELTKNFSSSDAAVSVGPAEETTVMANGQPQRWTLDGLMSECQDDIASSHCPTLNMCDQLTSTNENCDQHLFTLLDSSLASDNDAVCHESSCKSCRGNSRSFLKSPEQYELFTCHECSVTCSKHFPRDGLHGVLHVTCHNDVDRTAFTDASLTVVPSEFYLTKVINIILQHYFTHSCGICKLLYRRLFITGYSIYNKLFMHISLSRGSIIWY